MIAIRRERLPSESIFEYWNGDESWHPSVHINIFGWWFCWFLKRRLSTSKGGPTDER